jgi:hypothetical protein
VSTDHTRAVVLSPGASPPKTVRRLPEATTTVRDTPTGRRISVDTRRLTAAAADVGVNVDADAELGPPGGGGAGRRCVDPLHADSSDIATTSAAGTRCLTG